MFQARSRHNPENKEHSGHYRTTQSMRNIRRNTTNHVNLFMEHQKSPRKVQISEIVCSTQTKEVTNSKYFAHPIFGRIEVFSDAEHNSWPSKTHFWCWHDCHKFDTPPVPIPENYNSKLKTYTVCGIFCSLSCAKAYIMENISINTPLIMLYLSQMALDLFNFRNEIVPAPARIRLNVFGGDLDIDTFRQKAQCIRSALIRPPFISSILVFEETILRCNPKNNPHDEKDHITHDVFHDTIRNVNPNANWSIHGLKMPRPLEKGQQPNLLESTDSLTTTNTSTNIPYEQNPGLYSQFLKKKQMLGSNKEDSQEKQTEEVTTEKEKKHKVRKEKTKSKKNTTVGTRKKKNSQVQDTSTSTPLNEISNSDTSMDNGLESTSIVLPDAMETQLTENKPEHFKPEPDTLMKDEASGIKVEQGNDTPKEKKTSANTNDHATLKRSNDTRGTLKSFIRPRKKIKTDDENTTR